MLESISSLEIFLKAIFEQFLMPKTKVANFHDFLVCFDMLFRSVEQIGPWVVGRSGMRWDAATFGRSEGGGSLVTL